MATQNTGVMSTPKAGGMLPLTTLSNGSVGHATTFQGNSFRFVSGYHEATTRHNMANAMKFKNGPSTNAVGCTHASVSAITKSDEVSAVAMLLVISGSAEMSIMDKDDVEGRKETDEDVGATKEAAS